MVYNWQKYNKEEGDEIVYQAEKMAAAIEHIVAAIKPDTELIDLLREAVPYLNKHRLGTKDLRLRMDNAIAARRISQ